MFLFGLFPIGVLFPVYVYTIISKRKLLVQYNDDNLPTVVFRYRYNKSPNDFINRCSLVSTDEHEVQMVNNHTNKTLLVQIDALTQEDFNNYIEYFSNEKIELEYCRMI